jgi:CheY-like chemotaxis protein
MRSILLVDDDPLQGLVRKSILEKRFPDVRRVTDAAEALCLIEQRLVRENLGLVISGHHSPGLGGPAFVNELRARLPEVPVLVLGGSTESAGDYRTEGVRFLARHAGNAEMLAAAREMLLKDGHPVA